MHLVALFLLVASLALLGWSMVKSRAFIAGFKALPDTRARQKAYRHLVLNSLLMFGGLSVLSLAAISRLDAVAAPPREFERFIGWLGPALPSAAALSTVLDFLAAEVVVGVLLGALVVWARRNKPSKARAVAVLSPRNGPETLYAALLSLNAGVCEELFFRLMLPLLIAVTTGSAALGFAVSLVIFGLMHLYQGVVGIIVTTVLGAAFTYLYLASGALWIAMAAHVVFDLLVLVVRPSLKRLLVRPAPQIV